MAISKVIYDGNTLMDITDSTVTADTLTEVYIAYMANGERIVGTRKDYTSVVKDYSPSGNSFEYTTYPSFSNGGYIEASISNWTEDTNIPNLISIGSNINNWQNTTGQTNYYFHIYGRQNALEIDASNGNGVLRNESAWTGTDNTIIIRLDSSGLSVNGTTIESLSTIISSIITLSVVQVGSVEGSNRSYATYNYIKFK